MPRSRRAARAASAADSPPARAFLYLLGEVKLQLLVELFFLALAPQPPLHLPKEGSHRASSVARLQEQSHGAGEGVPFRLFGSQLRAPLRGDSIEAGALALVGQLPGGRDPAFGLEPIECGVQRAGLDLQQVFGGPLNVLRDRVSVARPGQERSQDQEVERAAQKIDTRRGLTSHGVETLHNIV